MAERYFSSIERVDVISVIVEFGVTVTNPLRLSLVLQFGELMNSKPLAFPGTTVKSDVLTWTDEESDQLQVAVAPQH